MNLELLVAKSGANMSKYKRPSIKALSAYWGIALASCSLLAISGVVMWQDIISFRSCNVNNTDLSVTTCGKASVNPGDGLLGVLFLFSFLLVISLFTHAYRLTRRPG